MRKFVVKLADGSMQSLMRSMHDTRNEAIQGIMDYVAKCNEGLGIEDSKRISPFDFKVEEVEVDDVDGVITSFGLAVEYLGLKDNGEYAICGREMRDTGSLKKRDVEKLVRELNPRHVDALIALNELFTIAEAWNKADGFVPDFSRKDQPKYFPAFNYSGDVAGFVFIGTPYTMSYAEGTINARLCFKTEERARQFGQRFEGLFNKFLMLDRREEVRDGR